MNPSPNPRSNHGPVGKQQRQTPPQRQTSPQRPTPPRRQSPPPLTPAQKRLIRAQRRKQRKRSLRRFRLYAVCTLTVYAVLVSVFALGIVLRLHSFPKTEVALPDVFLADAEQDRFSSELKGKKYAADKLRRGDLLYLEVDLLASYAELSESGNSTLRTLHLNGQTASFYVGTTSVYLNGQHTSLSAPSILRDSRLCVPPDFFAQCLQGLQVRTDAETQRIIFEKTGPLGFVLQEDRPMDSIPYEQFLNQVKPQPSTNQ